MKIFRINPKHEAPFHPLFSEFPGTDEDDVVKFAAINDDLKVCGVMACYISGFEIHVIALYVLPEFRRQGYGKALLNEAEFLAKAQEAEATQADFVYIDEACDFYASCGFDVFYTGEQYYLTLGDLKRSRLYKRYLKDGKVKAVAPVSTLPSRVKELLDKEANDRDYDPDYSSVSIKDGKLTSCLFALVEGNEICITWFAVYSSNYLLLLYQLRQLVRTVEEKNPDNNDIRVRMCFEDSDIVNDVMAFLGGRGHMRLEDRIVSAIKLR